MSESKIPAHVQEIREKVFVSKERVHHPSEIEDPHAFSAYGVDNSFSLEDFKRGLSIRVQESTKERIIFDLVGTTAPIANAMRRIMLAEVPTMAIEQVDLYQNTSLINDEVLAHRLGLIPIQADPRMFQRVGEDGKLHELNTLLFTLDVECTAVPNVPAAAPDELKYQNSIVFSSDLKWVPQGSQAERFRNNPIKPIHDDIVIAKLRPGQKIEAELYVQKGDGKTHAKWSPVATAFYRLMPEISFSKPVIGAKARELVAKCPMKVFDIEELASQPPSAVVARPRNCSMCRECVREPEWQPIVNLRRDRRHFIFSVESVGMYKPEEIVDEALKVLAEKCKVLLAELRNHKNSSRKTQGKRSQQKQA